jgi:hypothetical protein
MRSFENMRRGRRLIRLAAAAIPALALAACKTSTAAEALSTTYGAAVRVGDGDARVYVVSAGTEPREIGIALSEAALSGLPADHAPGGVQMPDGHHTYDLVLQMPSQHATPYKFALLGWNPAGHEPAKVYDQPHFDFHFYTISDAERGTILPTDPEFARKAARGPSPDQVPAGYTQLPGAVPMMGAHWVDPSSPELNGATFTQTFLYGSWDGKLAFAEPMITKAFLESKPDLRTAIKVPARYAAPGYYPKEYRVYWEPTRNEYRVALAGLTQQQ